MKYCKYCGRMLQDNEQCTCEDAKKELMSASEDQTNQPSDSTKENDISDNHQTQEQMDTNQTPDNSESVPDGNAKVTSETPSQSSINAESRSDTQIPHPIHATHDESTNHHTNHTSTKATFKVAFHNILPYLRAFIKAPASTVETAAKSSDLPLAIILYSFYAITCVLSTIILSSKIIGSFTNIIQMITGYSYIKINYFSVILCMLLVSLIYIVITNTLIVFFVLSTRSGYKIKQIISANASIFVYPAIFNLIGIIMLLFSVQLSIAFISLGNLAYLLMVFFNCKTLCKKSDNSPFLLAMILIVGLIQLFVVLGTAKTCLSFVSNFTNTKNITQNYYNNNQDSTFDYLFPEIN